MDRVKSFISNNAAGFLLAIATLIGTTYVKVNENTVMISDLRERVVALENKIDSTMTKQEFSEFKQDIKESIREIKDLLKK